MDSRQRNVALAGAAAMLLSVGIVAVSAAAEDDTTSSSSAATATTSLVLTITPSGGAGHSVTLTCPAGGTHPDPKDACAALDAAGGDIGKVTPASGQMCPHYVRPVTATANGTYSGRPESWAQTFNNSCELDRATHPIFAF